MNVHEAIRQAYLEGCERESGVHRACVEWYIEELSPPMEQAEEMATQAYLAASRGDLRNALKCIRRACQFERQEYSDCATWRPLREAIRAALHVRRECVAENQERSCCHA